MALSWNILENRLDVEGRVHPLDLPQCPLWRFVPMEKVNSSVSRAAIIARKRAGASGCPVAHLMIQAHRMCVQQSIHSRR